MPFDCLKINKPMKDLAYSSFEKLDLRKNLVTIRTYGLDRSAETEEIMNAIIGKVMDWSKTNCRDFYKAVLEHYSNPFFLAPD